MDRFFKKLESGINQILGLMGLAGIVVMTIGVVTRYILKIPLNWSDEFLRTMFIWAYFIGAAMMFSSGGLMRLEMLDDFLEKRSLVRLKKTIKIVVEIATAGFFSIITYYVYELAMSYVRKGTTSSTSNVTAWVLILGMGIGFAMIIGFSIRNIIRILRQDTKMDKPANK